MLITSLRRSTFAVALLLVLPCRSGAGEAEAGPDDNARARVLSSAAKAIRSHRGGVFVVKIEGSFQIGRSWTFWHVVTVEEVLKPYRSDKGAYFIPLTINERTQNRKAKLLVGQRYLIVTRLKWAAWSPLYVADALGLRAEKHPQLVKEIRAQAKEHAVYGSSWYLRSELRGPLEVSGVQTLHANGFVDPKPFGFTPESLRKAVADGMSVLLVRPPEGPNTKKGKPFGPRDRLVEVLEDLAQGGNVARKLWIHDPQRYDEKVARTKNMPAPYRLPEWLPHRRYIVLVNPRAETLPLIKAILPVISDNGPTVRRIRSWLQREGATVRVRFEQGGKPYAAKGLRVSLGVQKAVCSDEGATFEDVKPGKYKLRVQRIKGFNPIAEREIEVRRGKAVEVVISLESDT